MEQTEKSMFQLLQRRTTGDYVPIKQVVLNALDKIEKASKSKGTVTGIPTGFIDLDYKLSGFQSDRSPSIYGKNGVCIKHCAVYGI